ncbi:precorrin-3B C(17)-methyltransferase [Cyanobium sp. Morenito 9A2]|uniref:precorrin-3B C(17)-methyltransferase n=1 Tax=Cyanobium sp. Morenito 9A2 TaxID=2823718 RepID=UPI0020CD78AE|nr:precorrin-3B C(17)-methyltransferase [Cyanobium sp. Morenito 9A2]MCP9850663.1 precorrin-3B C(17)-methyltransferase [Cyanobium sp. Morenito 9A2]
MKEQPIRGLGLSPAATPVLERLRRAGLLDEVGPAGEAGSLLRCHWEESAAFVVVGACGAVVRLIAPLLSEKSLDPAVVVVDPQGRYAIPLLGGHGAGAEPLSRRIAALLGGEAVLTGACAASGRLPLDSFGAAWGWRRGQGDWSPLMKAINQGHPLQLRQESGSSLWRQSPAAQQLALIKTLRSDGSEPTLVISHSLGEGLRWHPPSLWLGLGCERNTSLSLLERAVDRSLAAHGLAAEAVAGLASAERKADEPALLELAQRRGWPLRCFEASELARVTVPNPSPVVEQELGTASVAEAAALLAAGAGAQLLMEKRIERPQRGEQGASTLAVALCASQQAPQRGRLHLVGSGPGSLELLTPDARQALAEATVWVGYGLYLDLLEPLRRPDQVRLDGVLTQETERCRQALELAAQGLTVALVSSGDSGIYGMAGLALELWMALPQGGQPGFQVHPGLSALQLAAARVGAPLMHDFCTISLSDRLTPWPTIEERLKAAALGDFVVALYNPRSQGRQWQLERARALLLEGRPEHTPVVLARQLGRPEEFVQLSTLGELPFEQVDMLTVVLVGNRSSRVEQGRMVTPRGYPGAVLA